MTSPAPARDAGTEDSASPPIAETKALAPPSRAELDPSLPVPARARLVANVDTKALLRVIGFDDARGVNIAYYAVVDTASLCIEATRAFPKIAAARENLKELDGAEAKEEAAHVRELAARFGRRTLDGLLFGADGKVALAADARERMHRRDAGGFTPLGPLAAPNPSARPGSTSAPPPAAFEDPSMPPLRDDALVVTTDGRVLFGYLEGATKECAAALDPTTGAVTTLVCARVRSDAAPTFAASPRGSTFTLVERTPSLNALVVYRTPPADSPRSTPKVLHRTTATNMFVVPSSFMSPALDDEGETAWESMNDFGLFVNRSAKGKWQWDHDNASLAGVLADGRVLLVAEPTPVSPGSSVPWTLEAHRCGAFRIGSFEDTSRR